MSLTEVEFFYFLPVAFLAYWVLPRRTGWQNSFLLLASYLFYASWNPRLLLLLLAATAVDYTVTAYLDRYPPLDEEAAGAAQRTRQRRAALAASMVFNLGSLGYFKYAGFFAESFNGLMAALGLPAALPVFSLVLPLGISFYTLQKLGYVIDVYYGRIPACRSPLTFATFVAFFPQITAGPISRGAQLLPQIAAPRQLTSSLIASGAGTFFLGFILKALAADSLQTLVDPVFSQPGTFGTGAHWIAFVGYAAQVFCDFAGYSLLAIGCAKLFGLELPVNFNYPFLATSLAEFWRRWHITLNMWLFDYIYGPLTTGNGRLRGRFRSGLIIVFLVSGLWHGAQWTFIAWGLLHGIGMVVHYQWGEFYRSLCRRDRSYVQLRQGQAYKTLAWILTQGFFVIALIPFRSPSLDISARFVGGLFGSAGSGFPDLGGLKNQLNLLLIASFLMIYHLAELQMFRPWRDQFFALPAPVRGVVYGLVLVYMVVFVPVGSSTFIYRQF
jgi:D-alanyl-lipoteichoic acid acyltransferase DltB (MBOAT superfamily)